MEEERQKAFAILAYMQLSNFIDIITRAESCLEEREQDFLFALLDSYEELYLSRRVTRAEKTFWNQFWYSWNYPKLRDARIQAFEDMAADKYLHHITENRSVYRNFEKAVALDMLRVRLQILYTLGCDFSDLHQEIFYNLQSHVQQSYESNDLPPLITERLVPATPSPTVTPKEVEISQSVKKEVASAVAASKKETKRQKRKRLKQEHKEQRIKEAKEKPHQSKIFLRLQVITPEGEYIETGNSNLTFLEFILRVGYKEVQSLKIQYEYRSIFRYKKVNGWFKEIKPGLYLNCQMNNDNKILIIDEVCNRLGLSYQASIIEVEE